MVIQQPCKCHNSESVHKKLSALSKLSK